jgi:predicted GH43/DUF377 family glycosyl hydrolase
MNFRKHPSNPVLGPGYTVTALFDACMLRFGEGIRSYVSWRDLKSIAASDSTDGVSWAAPRLVLEVDPAIAWEGEAINRPHVVQANGRWYMWYTGQNFTQKSSAIGLALSDDGLNWQRVAREPVLTSQGGWEKGSVMCPFVLHENGRFRMWYSGGEMWEPDAVGYAESDDGIVWHRHPANPVLSAESGWESDRVTAACIVPYDGAYLAFYIGFAEGFERSAIGVARSADGITGWTRHAGNPLLGKGLPGDWDDCNVYKPFVLPFRDRWYLWYNASRASDRREQIGLAIADTLSF